MNLGSKFVSKLDQPSKYRFQALLIYFKIFALFYNSFWKQAYSPLLMLSVKKTEIHLLNNVEAA